MGMVIGTLLCKESQGRLGKAFALTDCRNTLHEQMDSDVHRIASLVFSLIDESVPEFSYHLPNRIPAILSFACR